MTSCNASLIVLISAIPSMAQLPVVPLQNFVSGGPVPTLATIWYRPDDITNANTASLVWWPDHSGNGYNASAPGVPWTNNLVNGHGAAWGTSAFITMTNAAAVTANIAGASCFTVINAGGSAGLDAAVSFREGVIADYRFGIVMSAGNAIEWAGKTHDGDTRRVAGPVSANPSGYFLAEAVVNYASGTARFYTNGTFVGSTSALTAANTSNTSSQANPSWLQFDQSSSHGLGSEFLFYTNVISDSTRTNTIEPYFGTKFGITINSTP